MIHILLISTNNSTKYLTNTASIDHAIHIRYPQTRPLIVDLLKIYNHIVEVLSNTKLQIVPKPLHRSSWIICNTIDSVTLAQLLDATTLLTMAIMGSFTYPDPSE